MDQMRLKVGLVRLKHSNGPAEDEAVGEFNVSRPVDLADVVAVKALAGEMAESVQARLPESSPATRVRVAWVRVLPEDRIVGVPVEFWRDGDQQHQATMHVPLIFPSESLDHLSVADALFQVVEGSLSQSEG